MTTAALVFWIIAIILFLFGVVFVLVGQSSERGYWAQRDPSGDARKDATKLPAIIRRTGHYAAGEYRAPLRITAIGVLVCEIAIGFAVIAAIVTVAG